MATPSSPSGSPEDGAASVVAEWAPQADSLALTVGGDYSQQSARAEDELRVTDTIEFNFVARPPLAAPLPPPDPLVDQLTAWTFGGLLLFLLGNGALLTRQLFPPTAAPATPLEQLSTLPPWQEAPLLSQANLSPEASLGLESLSAVPAPLPPSPKPAPPVAVAPRLSAPPPPPPQSWPQPLAARLLTPPAPVQAPAPPTSLPTLAVRPADLTPPPPPPTSPPPNPIEGNPPINLLQSPVSPENPPSPPLEQVRQQLQPQLEPSPALSFNAQTRQRLLKMQNPAMANPAPSPAPADITEIDRTQQLIQELESLNQAP